ncbi:hypothetical protein [Psychromonas ossibalaenae]|uniref:hypothetical protein n=1 Tax=Psychromonas ossibalaenae TaxID=444922 RepID=UPI000370AC6D|nr:hypothetical protein [Psychromonas ossibalaenae]
MIKNICYEAEWLDQENVKPSSLSWGRTNDQPLIRQRRTFLGPSGLLQEDRKLLWVLFQPGNSSVDKSFVDYPDELQQSYLVKVELLCSEKFAFSEEDHSRYYSGTLNTWYDCIIIERINLYDIPELLGSTELKSLPDYDENEAVTMTEFESFFVIYADDQAYAGKKSLYIKQNNKVYLTLHHEYFGDDRETTCYNYRLTPEQIIRLKAYL